MGEEDLQRSLAEIRSLRGRGLITPKEAYERHMSALALHAPPQLDLRREGITFATNDATEHESKAAASSRWALDALAVGMAVVGGLLGILGAIVQEVQSAGILSVFFAAPIIEEALKPAGIYVLLLRWPHAIRSQLHGATLTALSGLCFGLIESFVYVTLYYPEHESDFVLFRFTVPVAMHAFASFVVGLGLSRALIDWASGRVSLPRRARNCYVGGVVIHSVYNTAAVFLSVAGVVNF